MRKAGQYAYKRTDFPIIRALALWGNGATNREIAADAGKTEHCVEKYFRELCLRRPPRARRKEDRA